MMDNVLQFLPLLLAASVVTLQVSVLALLVSSALGLVLALLKLSPNKAFSYPASATINIIRGLPILIVLFYMYFVLPELGINLTAFEAGVLGLGIGYAGYQAEIFRAGIQTVDQGQVEAAKAIGMKPSMTMRRVVLPQAWRISLPPYANTFTMILKDSSLVSTITVAEMTHAGQLIASSTFQNMTVYTLTALLYLAMSFPLLFLVGWLERRLRR
ncbi:amino acid ABC transporter permease [Pseudomonas sp. LRF_L74]|uniref:amino acid ABC transporter permease n=1 Tax=Pseudomonas sp. LRF_L74 TaxID=3369422 RepID=UPI003F637BD6